eukprot:gnl/Dysnectes_brevis/3148_a3921_1448.p1 GENE.gnl/Dysnectes_brevis/3148_a3921_1448~~gnl/Dysnectes_brevis/3148_a3921_1448.p1  ORF type:complete len:231 (-),score=56.01 gnl/Dysnectes_brevis/3148_a3921_1448:53-745(-)
MSIAVFTRTLEKLQNQVKETRRELTSILSSSRDDPKRDQQITRISSRLKAIDPQFLQLQKQYEKLKRSPLLTPADKRLHQDSLNKLSQSIRAAHRAVSDVYRSRTSSSMPAESGPAPAHVTTAQMATMKEERDVAMDHLIERAKMVKHVMHGIGDELDDQVALLDDVEDEIQDAGDDVLAGASRTEALRAYMKKHNKPWCLFLLMLIFTVLFWSSHALCDVGVSYQCGPS